MIKTLYQVQFLFPLFRDPKGKRILRLQKSTDPDNILSVSVPTDKRDFVFNLQDGGYEIHYEDFDASENSKVSETIFLNIPGNSKIQTQDEFGARVLQQISHGPDPFDDIDVIPNTGQEKIADENAAKHETAKPIVEHAGEAESVKHSIDHAQEKSKKTKK